MIAPLKRFSPHIYVGTCRSLRTSVLKSNVWRDAPLDICLIPRCFGCGRMQRSVQVYTFVVTLPM